MKELSENIKAIDVVKQMIADGQISQDVAENYFPELKKSEGEKMWKLIKKYAHSNISDMVLDADHITREQLESWLEKQSKQNLTNKIEPKFHEGEWIICFDYEPVQIISTTDNMYEMSNGDFRPFNMVDNNHNIRLWTIKDAKDGDILVHSSFMFDDFIFIYNNTSILQAYCYYSHEINRFIIEDKGHYCPWNMQEVTPATKEQRDTLMKAMSDAGYTFDFEKKKLKKIEHKPLQWNISDYRTWQYIVADVLTKHDGIGQYLDNGFCQKIAKYMQEEWSKKLCLIQHTDCNEEDEDTIKFLISHFCVSHCNRSFQFTDNKLITHDELLEKIRNLRPHWKPSKDQMDALDYYANSICTYSDRQDDLRSLFNNLKKLTK